jgi:Dna[CI] antecedent, DciA
MERASQLLLNSKLGSKTGGEAAVAKGAWRSAVGKRLDGLTYAAAFEKGTLRVYVEDLVWQAQLAALKPQILANIRKVTGRDLVRDIELRVMPGRRGPAMETQIVRAHDADSTDNIEDPILRRAFQRKQA